jgi:hypothetical protein
MKDNLTETQENNTNSNAGILGIHGDGHAITNISNGSKDEVIEEKEKRIVQYHRQCVTETRLLQQELKQAHEALKQKDNYIGKLIESSYNRNEQNMKRLDRIIQLFHKSMDYNTLIANQLIKILANNQKK